MSEFFTISSISSKKSCGKCFFHRIITRYKISQRVIKKNEKKYSEVFFIFFSAAKGARLSQQLKI